jgi:hypothetical protein
VNPHDLKQRWLTVALNNARIDAATWIPHRGVRANQSTIEAVYRYYGSLYLSDARYEWAGMANLMGPSFYGGFLDMAAVPTRLLRFYETTFLRMQKKIFEDQAVMHEAYRVAGIEEILALRQAGILDLATLQAWEAIDSHDAARLPEGNRWLLYREQDDILDFFYTTMRSHRWPQGAALTYLMTLLGNPSVPGARGYPEVLPLTLHGGPLSLRTPLADGSIALFPDRWELIERDTLPAYLQLLTTPHAAEEAMHTPVAERTRAYRLRSYWPAIIAAMLSNWSIRAARARRSDSNASTGSRHIRQAGVSLDLRHKQVPGAAVRAWTDTRHHLFTIDVTLPERKHYVGHAQLVKLYLPAHATSPMRLTIKLPASNLQTTIQTLQQLSREWNLNQPAIDAWRNEIQRPADAGYHYSTRVFTSQPTDFVATEIQVEHHVKEQQFIIDVLLSIRPPD